MFCRILRYSVLFFAAPEGFFTHLDFRDVFDRSNMAGCASWRIEWAYIKFSRERTPIFSPEDLSRKMRWLVTPNHLEKSALLRWIRTAIWPAVMEQAMGVLADDFLS
jgi:hypothetical protein